MVTIIKPYAIDKNLGREYNRVMNMIPENEWACLCDLDTMFLTPDAGKILIDYADIYNNAEMPPLLTCFTNRIHPTSPQLYNGKASDITDIAYHIYVAEGIKNQRYSVSDVKTNISGFLMLINKRTWEKYKFSEDLKCLGVDSEYSARLLKDNVPIYVMSGLYIFHQYRITTHIQNKDHLL